MEHSVYVEVIILGYVRTNLETDYNYKCKETRVFTGELRKTQSTGCLQKMMQN